MRALSTHGTTNDVGRVMHLTTVPERAARIKQPQHEQKHQETRHAVLICVPTREAQLLSFRVASGGTP